MALGDAILACLTERPMTGYELAKTFDASIGFYWKANHQQIYRELTKLRDRGHVQGREVVQSGKPNKLVYTLTSEGRAALRHWAARPSIPASIKDDLLVRLYALDSVDIDPLRADLMARLEHHRDRCARYERILDKRFPRRNRLAGRYRQAAGASPRRSPRARRGGVVRRGAPGVAVGAARRPARQGDRRPIPSAVIGDCADAQVRNDGRPRTADSQFRPAVNFTAGRPHSLTRYLP